MPYFFYDTDTFFIILMVIAAIFASWAQINVKSTFAKYSKIPSRGMTGYDSARAILDANGLHNVRIGQVAGELTDHYNPQDNTIYLSESVYDKTTVAALGVAAHEAGHAVQHATGYAPIQIRQLIIPITSIGSNVAMPLILLGVVLSFPTLAYIGVLAFGFSTLFQLITLPVEFNASRRAMTALRERGMDADELSSAKKVLTAAALTYVAALAVSLVNFLRLLAIANNSKNRRR